MTDNRIPADANAPVETLCQGRWLSLRKRGRWEYAERNNPGGAVIIVAVTPEDRVLFVEQYRVSILKHTIEMPAGLVGDLAEQLDENALLAAARELEEETGYQAAQWENLGEFYSSPGMLTESFTLVKATGLTRVGDGGGTPDEDIVVHRVPLKRVEETIAAHRARGHGIDVKPLLLLGSGFLEDAAQ